MILHIFWFFFGVVVGVLGAGFFFAMVRDRERAALSKFLHDHWEEKP
jgi:hypothetical protein